MPENKKTPSEAESRRVTQADVDAIRKAARTNEDKYLLALSYVMQEIVYIRELLEQQH